RRDVHRKDRERADRDPAAGNAPAPQPDEAEAWVAVVRTPITPTPVLQRASTLSPRSLPSSSAPSCSGHQLPCGSPVRPQRPEPNSQPPSEPAATARNPSALRLRAQEQPCRGDRKSKGSAPMSRLRAANGEQPPLRMRLGTRSPC